MYWYPFKPPNKPRPVLVLTRTTCLEHLNCVTVAPITTTIRRKVSSQVILTPEDGLPESCAVNLDNVQTVLQERLGELITTLSDARMAEVESAIRFALGMN